MDVAPARPRRPPRSAWRVSEANEAPRGTSRPWLAPALLFFGAALIAAFTLLRGVDPFDEGLMLSAARRVGDGQLPYRDFLWSYGPGQPYLLAGVAEVFG